MITFKQFMSEGYKNLFEPSDKEKYAKEVFSLLQNAYEYVGGVKGSGFSSAEEMVNKIPFWKLRFKDGTLIAAALYKDKQGRKRVAICSDGSKEGKHYVADIMVNDLLQDRSYAEQSGSSLQFLVKCVGYDLIKKYALNPSDLKIQHDIPDLNDAEVKRHPELKDFFYTRKINDLVSTKIALGTHSKLLK